MYKRGELEEASITSTMAKSWAQDEATKNLYHPTRVLPIIWTDELFSEVPALWRDSHEHGLCHGWSQSVQDGPGGMGLTSLSRTLPALSAHELNEKYDRMQWLAQMTHTLLSRIIRSQNAARVRHLTSREIEVLKWTADGKSSQDIADILTLSKNTVDFHIKNIV